ncbi:MAG: hypothetical protein KAJ12_08690 [Bacteroidetes bacterium]|nr:hypothetical protein [Bacteroidota bacterium]
MTTQCVFPQHLAILLLLGYTMLFPASALCQDGQNLNHYFSGYLFEVYEDSKPANRYLVMTVSARQKSGTAADIECTLVHLIGNALDRAYTCELRHYSTSGEAITRPAIGVDSLTFDLHVGGSDADKKLQFTCARDENTGTYAVKASGLWSDQTHTEYTRVEWKQVDSIELEHQTLLPARN